MFFRDPEAFRGGKKNVILNARRRARLASVAS